MNEHLVADFMKLGCRTKKEAAITLQLYLELCEVKKYWDVGYAYDEDLKCMYVMGKKSKSKSTSIFIPVAVSDDISFAQMNSYLSLCKGDVKTIYLVMMDSDSTCVFYQITDGIVSPTVEASQMSREEKREKLDGELKKYRKLLEQSAMYGTPITLNCKKSD